MSTRDNHKDISHDALPEGYELHWYEIKSILGRGSFGITYLALDKNLDQLVAIKEYFPSEFSTRKSARTVHPVTDKNNDMYAWGLDRFIKEARILAKFKHTNIVRVLSVFEHNNTAYMVMEHVHGNALSLAFKNKEPFSENKLLEIFLPILDGLKLVHDAGFIHRDIKPSNIIIREDGSPVLIDFGAARQVSGSSTQALTSLVTYGYAPFEQYNESEETQGPWTDIYALGASLHCGLIGKQPIDALARGSSLLSTNLDPYEPLSISLKEKYSNHFLMAIDHALLFHTYNRPQDVLLWASMLKGKAQIPQLPSSIIKMSEYSNDQIETVAPIEAPNIKQENAITKKPDPSSTETGITNRNQPKHLKRTKSVALASLAGLTLIVGIAIFLLDEKQSSNTNTTQLDQQINSIITKANDARLQGNYLEPKNQSALNLYTQVLELDSTHTEALNRTNEIISLYSDGIRSDITEGYYEKAATKLQLLLAHTPNSAELLTLQNELKNATSNTAQTTISHKNLDQPQTTPPQSTNDPETNKTTTELLARANDYFSANQLTTPSKNNAYETYLDVLNIAPDNQTAKDGISNIANQYLNLALQELENKNLELSKQYLEQGLKVAPEHNALISLNARHKAAQKEKAINDLLKKAAHQHLEKQLTLPTEDNAYKTYQQILKLDSSNQEALTGIAGIARHYFDFAKTREQNRQHEEALELIDRGLTVAPDNTQLLNLRKTVADELKKIERLAQESIIREQNEAKKHQEIASLLTEAEQHMVAQALIKPTGANAHEKFRRVLALDPQNQNAQKGVMDIATHYETLARKHSIDGHYEQSQKYIKQGLSVIPSHEPLLLLDRYVKLRIAELQQPAESNSAPEDKPQQTEEKKNIRIFGNF